MKRINNFVDSVYTHVNGSKKEIDELKEEMQSHLIESVHELQKEGKSEDEAIDIAIKRFGERNELKEVLTQVFQKQKVFAKWVLALGIIVLLLGSLIFGSVWTYSEQNARENSDISTEIRGLIEGIDKLTEEIKFQSEEVISKANHITELNIYDLKSLDTSNHYWDVIEEATPTYQYKKSLSLPKWLMANYSTAGNGDSSWCITYEYLSLNDFALIILFMSISIYGTLFTIWAVINAYHHKRLNIGWTIIFAVFNIVGYCIYRIYGRMTN
ncbi:Uncharacterised protein [Turicibacter sanguinis]|nr:Uncharacterised protein [Turicibacter sanguinis]